MAEYPLDPCVFLTIYDPGNRDGHHRVRQGLCQAVRGTDRALVLLHS
jgi:hypothetical protein